MHEVVSAHGLKVDYACWKCKKEVLPDQARKDANQGYVQCPHCGASLIRGVGKWVRPYSTLAAEEKS